MTVDEPPLTLIGHPFAPIGMGEQLRSHISACDTVGLHHQVLDIFRFAERDDEAHHALVAGRERRDLPDGIRVFHVNGDEVERVIEAADARGGAFAGGYNVIVPAWELPRYPAIWAERLRRFDEVWAISRFVADGLAAAGIASRVVGQSVEPEPVAGGWGPLLPRRAFGVRESAFVLLHFFDQTSFASRKNPQAALTLFQRLREEHPFADLQLVLKVKNGAKAAEAWPTSDDPDVVVLSEPLDSLGVRSLIAACDCFVSLHRAEGFGRGLGEAMALGRLALGTNWSGNVDFMNDGNSLPVACRLIDVAPDAYPHAEGQRWAEPDIDDALRQLRPVVADPARDMARSERGRREVLLSHGRRAVGLRVLRELERIAGGLPPVPPKVGRRRRALAS